MPTLLGLAEDLEDGGRGRELLVLRWHDLLFVAEAGAVDLPLLFTDPLVVEADDVFVGAVVYREGDLLADVFAKTLAELEDVLDGGATETVETLVVVADHAEVLA